MVGWEFFEPLQLYKNFRTLQVFFKKYFGGFWGRFDLAHQTTNIIRDASLKFCNFSANIQSGGMMKVSGTVWVMLAALLLTFTAHSAWAWDSLGHMLTAQIAWEQLTPEARAGVEKLLADFNQQKAEERHPDDVPYDFVTAACWMDDIRSMKDRYDIGAWHYVDLPFNEDGLPLPPDGEAPNVIWGIGRMLDILAGKAEDPQISRAQALFMLTHLVGDIHQPLHTTNRGNDYGGNAVSMRNMDLSSEDRMFSKRKTGNLHAFWDSSYRRRFREERTDVIYDMPAHDVAKPVLGHKAALELIRREADSLRQKFPNLGAPDLDQPEEWAQESHRLGYELGYGKLIPLSKAGRVTKVDEHYVNTAREAAEQRLVLAGNRMAALLNRAFSSPDVEK